MLARLRSAWFSVRASYWFFPMLFSILGFALGVGLVHLDSTGDVGWLQYFDAIQPARPQGASNMLTVLAGSMLGVASTVFSITIAAVAYASGTYGPRLLTNFMDDRGNQLSLATFIGTFVYAITVLRTVRAEDETTMGLEGAARLPGFVPQLSLLVGFVLMLIAIGVLVYFLNHIPASIRINSVLEDIGERLIEQIAEAFPETHSGIEPERISATGSPVPAGGAGYVRVIDGSALVQTAKRHGVRMTLEVRPGDFVHEGVPLARLDDDARADDDLIDDVRDCFAVGGSRTHEQDLEFSLDELVEIALRALSPGINDPFTAITALHWLGAATAELGRRDLRVDLDKGGEGECPVTPLNDDFAHFVQRGFGAVRSGLAGNRLAALVALDTLASAARSFEDPRRRAALAAEADMLMRAAAVVLVQPDLEEVRTRHVAAISAIRS